MTLKRCKVTQLDDTFWRVDWEGAATVDKDARRITHSSPRIAEHHDGEWFFCGYWSKSLADALALWGLAAEQPKPETAEGRVRWWSEHGTDMGKTLSDGERHSVGRDDLRAILAELDRLRDAYDAQSADLLRERRLSDDLKSALRMPGHGSYVEYAKEVRAELDRLRAREAKFALGPSVDAALAPVREALCRSGCACGRSPRRSREDWEGQVSDSMDAARTKLHRALVECSGVISDLYTFADVDADGLDRRTDAIVNLALAAKTILIRALVIADESGSPDVVIDCRTDQEP